jgi:hypothetical protein
MAVMVPLGLEGIVGSDALGGSRKRVGFPYPPLLGMETVVKIDDRIANLSAEAR